MSRYTEIKLSRQELHQQVWEKPMRDLAKELGMSDVGLRKLCHRNGIPTPPQGYHLMKEGPKKKRLYRPLPQPKTGQDNEFTFKKTSEFIKDEIHTSQTVWEDLLKNPPHEITKQETREIKRTIKTIQEPLNRKKVDERGILLTPMKDYPIRVSSSKLTEAVEYLNALFQRLACLGSTLPEYTKSDRGPLLALNWRGYEFRFRVEEFSNRYPVPPEERPKRSYSFYSDQWKYLPTGNITVDIWGPGYGSLNMKDGKTRKINERIDELAKRMFIRAFDEAEKDRVEKIRMKNAIKHLQKKDEIRREQEFEVLKQKKLLQEVRSWRRVTEIRAYIAAVEEMGPQSSAKVFNSEKEWADWINWAQKYADSIDITYQGLVGSPPPYPEAKEITGVPYFYLDFDDPVEAEKHKDDRYWW